MRCGNRVKIINPHLSAREIAKCLTGIDLKKTCPSVKYLDNPVIVAEIDELSSPKVINIYKWIERMVYSLCYNRVVLIANPLSKNAFSNIAKQIPITLVYEANEVNKKIWGRRLRAIKRTIEVCTPYLARLNGLSGMVGSLYHLCIDISKIKDEVDFENWINYVKGEPLSPTSLSFLEAEGELIVIACLPGRLKSYNGKKWKSTVIRASTTNSDKVEFFFIYYTHDIDLFINKFFEENTENSHDSSDDGLTPNESDIVPLPLPSDSSDNLLGPDEVCLTQQVLDDMAIHAISAMDLDQKECYGTIYAKKRRIIKYHPIDSEDFTLRSKSNIRFTEKFYDHVRYLVNLYKNIGLNLAGDNHSHPNGIPEQSTADVEFTRSFWKSSRNTCFITSITRSIGGPAEWMLDRMEVKRQIGNWLIRIKAFAGSGEEVKKIVISYY